MAKCTLPERSERLEHAEKAVGGEGMANGRVADTHYLGGKQWAYGRRMAKYGGVYNEELEAFLTTNQVRSREIAMCCRNAWVPVFTLTKDIAPIFFFQKIYDHTGGLRKNTFPAGPDTYREYVYERNDANSDFRLVETPNEAMANVE